MARNSGMTLAEVLIGSFVFTIIALMFTTGLFFVMKLIGAADETKLMEQAADEVMLSRSEAGIDYLDADRIEYSEFDTELTIIVGELGEIQIYGQKQSVRVNYQENLTQTGVERRGFIFEGLAYDD